MTAWATARCPRASDDPWHTWELLTAHASNDRFGQHHSDDSESLGPVEATIAEATKRLLAAQPDRQAITLNGRYIDANGALDRSPLRGAVGIWVLPDGQTAFVPGRGTIFAFPGRRFPPGVRANQTALAPMDYDGRPQPSVADGTAGALIGCRTAQRRLYVDVYRNLGGATTASRAARTSAVIPPACGVRRRR